MAVCIPAVYILAVCSLDVCILAVRTLLGWPIAIAQGPDKVLTVGFSELVAQPPVMLLAEYMVKQLRTTLVFLVKCC